MTKAARYISLRDISELAKGRCPGQVVLQYTDRCNALCPQCGMRATEKFERSKLSLSDAKRTIDAAAARGVASLSITGGEPMLFQEEVIQLLRHARAAGIRYTRTGTNGFLFTGHEGPGFEKRVSILADALVEAGVYSFWISIDAADPGVHEGMRGLKGVWNGIGKAVPIFHRHGLYPSANLGINRRIEIGQDLPPGATLYDRFRDSFARFYSAVIDLGFTTANCCYPMDDANKTPVYRAAAGDDIVSFSPEERATVYEALFDAIGEYRSKIRIFTPLSSLYALIMQHASGRIDGHYPCRGGTDYFFVSASDGNVYPCGYRGQENLGKLWEPSFAGSDRDCIECDWECFRDPSELVGPLTEILARPLKLLKAWVSDRRFFRTWVTDLKYYSACDFFNGLRPPSYAKLSKRGWEGMKGWPPVLSRHHERTTA